MVKQKLVSLASLTTTKTMTKNAPNDGHTLYPIGAAEVEIHFDLAQRARVPYHAEWTLLPSNLTFRKMAQMNPRFTPKTDTYVFIRLAKHFDIHIAGSRKKNVEDHTSFLITLQPVTPVEVAYWAHTQMLNCSTTTRSELEAWNPHVCLKKFGSFCRKKNLFDIGRMRWNEFLSDARREPDNEHSDEEEHVSSEEEEETFAYPAFAPPTKCKPGHADAQIVSEASFFTLRRVSCRMSPGLAAESPHFDTDPVAPTSNVTNLPALPDTLHPERDPEQSAPPVSLVTDISGVLGSIPALVLSTNPNKPCDAVPTHNTSSASPVVEEGLNGDAQLSPTDVTMTLDATALSNAKLFDELFGIDSEPNEDLGEPASSTAVENGAQGLVLTVKLQQDTFPATLPLSSPSRSNSRPHTDITVGKSIEQAGAGMTRRSLRARPPVLVVRRSVDVAEPAEAVPHRRKRARLR